MTVVLDAPELSLRFADALCPREAPSGFDVVCKLQHFAIVTYAFDPQRFAGVMPPRFALDTVVVDGVTRGLLSVVPFIDVDFTSAVFPFPKFRMGQTNYRVYIVDLETGERCVWFLGTTLDSWTRIIPHGLWNLPWYGGRVRFDCEQAPDGRYLRYRMETEASWAPASLSLVGVPAPIAALPGFADEETALVYLTHPLRGFYHRRDGRLGTYHVWHDRLRVEHARLEHARFGLLDRLGLVHFDEQQRPHSVLVEPINEFTIYLPPKVLDQEAAFAAPALDTIR